MPTARLAVTLPEDVWIADLSSRHPEATFRVLAALPDDDDTGVGLVEITAPDMEAVLSQLDAVSGVRVFELLHRGDDRALIQFETDEPLLLLSIRNSRTPFEPPITIVDGVADLELTASRDRLSSLADQLRTFGLEFDVRSVRTSMDPESVVTDRQRDLLETAVERGYYHTPRTCTLTELADHLDIAKSTASERLHRAEGAIIRAFVADASVVD
ncbi:helix-turn-helix domain-containing protein [Haloplanus rallus]|jgi:predicted DNA binding protein|uniref:Helix-turn-helix domain-containing protein n=1 Tax=Haloplanus rallus TaxID=1816183 RepID=A0A6B9F7H8_9EURY|nr:MULTISPECIES: helix-turn-helix domain-containing protein [Haloplanus]QGX96388.1 helix-turn-helix domain-containing protein [Haloplanus rallus]